MILRPGEQGVVENHSISFANSMLAAWFVQVSAHESDSAILISIVLGTIKPYDLNALY